MTMSSRTPDGLHEWLPPDSVLPGQADDGALRAHVEQAAGTGIVRWCAEDVIAAAERNGVTLTEAQAEKWLEKNERWFKEMLTEYGNEVLASASKESFEEVREG